MEGSGALSENNTVNVFLDHHYTNSHNAGMNDVIYILERGFELSKRWIRKKRWRIGLNVCVALSISSIRTPSSNRSRKSSNNDVGYQSSES